MRATASIAANVAEGYSRGTTADRRRFLEYALGSARECVVWYEASDCAEKTVRLERLVSIRRLLLTMIRTARHLPASLANPRTPYRPYTPHRRSPSRIPQ